MTKHEFRTTILLAGIYVTRMLGLFLIFPTFSLLVQGLDNVTPWKIGIALGIYGFAQALFQIPAGILSDIIGRKKVLILGLGLFLLGSILASITQNLDVLIVARLLQGMGAVSAVCLACIADGIRSSEQSKAMMVIGISIALSFVLSFVFGSIVASSWGLSGIFIFTTFLALCAIVFAAALPATSQTLTTFKIRDFIAVLKDGALVLVNMQIALLHMVLAASFFLFPLLLDLHLPNEDKVFLYVVPIVGAFVCVGGMLRKVRSHVGAALPYFWGIFSVSFILFGTDPAFSTPLWFMSILAMYFFAFTLLETLLPTRLFELATTTTRGATSGIFSVYQFCGNFLGALAGAKLYTIFSEGATINKSFYVLAGACIVMTLLTFVNKNNRVAHGK